MTVIDWNALMHEAATASAALPVGDYDMVVVDAQHSAASTGRPMYKVKLKVESGPHANRTVTNNFVLTVDNPTALRIFFRHMACLGLDGNFFASNPQPTVVAQSMINRRARVSLGVRKWQGEDRNEVTNVQPPMGGAIGQAPAAPPLGALAAAAPLGAPGAPMQPQFTPPMPAVPTFDPAAAQQPQFQPQPQQVPIPQPVMPTPAAAPPAPQPQFAPPTPQPNAVMTSPDAPPVPQPQFTPQQPEQQPQQPQQSPQGFQIPPGYQQMPDGSIVPIQQAQPPQPPQPPAPAPADPNAPPPLPY